MDAFRRAAALFAGYSVLLAWSSFAAAQTPAEPLVKTGRTDRLSDHVHVILDDNVGLVPNVGIIVGDRATLIVDTGLGERNGRVVLHEAEKLAGGGHFYLTATHFHPEHDLGATAFPEDARMLRWIDQQREVDEVGQATIDRFAGFSRTVADFLKGARFRAPDILFDEAITIDLGGVHVRAFGVGPNHTRGDTAFFIVEDHVLFTGDTVMSVFPAVSAASGDLDKWLRNLDRYEALAPVRIVPAHGRLGDLALVRRYRQYFTAVVERVRDAKARGITLDAVRAKLAPAIAEEFADLSSVNGPATGRINAAIEAAFRDQ